SPALRTSACSPAPKYVAITRSRTRPMMRLSRMPVAMSIDAARLERGGGVEPGGSTVGGVGEAPMDVLGASVGAFVGARGLVSFALGRLVSAVITLLQHLPTHPGDALPLKNRCAALPASAAHAHRLRRT